MYGSEPLAYELESLRRINSFLFNHCYYFLLYHYSLHHRSLLLNVPGVCILVGIACLSGMVLFANYAECDPLKAGLIKSKDQIIPYFVLDHLGSWQGLPGVFMACLFSGALRFVQ